jgi:hypothetical protein
MLEGCADQNMIKCKVFFVICEEAGTDLTAVLDVQDKPKTSIGMWTFFIASQLCPTGFGLRLNREAVVEQEIQHGFLSVGVRQGNPIRIRETESWMG